MPSAPEYFRDSAILNKDGYKNNDDLIKGSLKKLSVEKIKNQLELNYLILDTRSPHDFFISHIKKSLNIPLSGRYAITAANLLGIKKSVILVCYKNDINESIVRLNRVGFENIIGYYILDDLTPKNITSSIKSIKANSAHNIDDYKYLDVRTKSEYAEKHVKGALNLPLFELNESINLLDKDSSYIVYCRSGYRSSVASSILKRNNINNIINISEGINGLSKNKSISFSLL